MGDVYHSAKFVTDQTAPMGGTNQVLDSYMPVGSNNGNGQWLFGLPRNTREVYVGTWWKTNSAFQGFDVNSNKVFFILSDYNNNLLSWLGGQDQPRQLVWLTQQTQTNNCHIPSYSSPGCSNPEAGPGTGWFNPNGPSNGMVVAGSGWHRIEVYQKASTSNDSRDGIIRTWLDGVLVGSYTGVNVCPNGFSEIQINHAWDGGIPCGAPRSRDCSREWHHYFDHLRISIPSGALPPFLITTASVPSAASGKPYAAYLKAEGGKTPYTWVISDGSLLPGLSLNTATGVISGAPTTGGKCSFTVKALDASTPPASATKSFSIVASGASIIANAAFDQSASPLLIKSSAGKVRFSLPSYATGDYRFSIFDLAGKKVYEHRAGVGGQGEVRIETALQNGIYFACFGRGRAMSTVRFHVMN